MALSAETEAIVNRLKAEGDLIRNSGTNSIRSVNIQLAKFDGLFNSINSNISEQTKIMHRQLGIAEDAIQSARTKEQYEEIASPAAAQTDDRDESNNRNTNEKIDKMSDSIANALSLQNIALGAAGLFVGYNLLKGFVDERTGGGFTAMENNLGNFATQLGSIDLSSLPTTLETMQTTMADLSDSLTSLRESIDYITSIGWADIAQGVLTSIGLLTAYNLTARIALRLMGNTPGMGGRRGLLRRLIPTLGAGGAAAALGTTINDPDVRGAQAEIDQNRQMESRRDAARLIREADELAAREAAERAALRAATAAGTTPPPNVMTTTPTPQPPSVMSNAPNQPHYRWTDPIDGQAYVTSRSGTVFRADSPQGRMILNMAPHNVIDGLPNVGAAAAVPGAHGRALASRLRGRIAQMAASKAWKAAATAIPLVGAIAGAGFAIWNLFRGDYTSASLQGSSIFMPTVTGTAVDITSVATEIFFALYEDEAGNTGIPYNPINPDHNIFMQEIGDAIATAVREYLESEGNQQSLERRMEYENATPEERAEMLAEAERLAWSYTNTPGGPVHHGEASQATTEAIQQLLNDPNNLGNYAYDSRGNLIFAPNANRTTAGPQASLGRMSYAPTEGGRLILFDEFGNPRLLTNQQQNGRLGQLLRGELDLAPAGGAVVINAPTNVSPIVNNVSGGRSVNQISVRSGVGTGFGSADPFGLPAVAN